MLNNEKITLMTKLALYEQKNNKKEMAMSKYFKGDYMAIEMIKSFCAITIAYVLGLGLWLMFRMESFIGHVKTTSSFTALVVVILVLYVIVTAMYMLISYRFYSNKFKEIRLNLKEYNGELKALLRIQENEYEAWMKALEEGGGEEE